MESNAKKGGADKSNRFYSKVYATFHCSRDNCGRVWTSAHGWNRDDEGSICEACDTKADLINAVDEMLKLDTYRCPNQSCKSDWQSIHDGNRTPQECEDCESLVFPEPSPQDRFGRHFFFNCKNRSCAEKPEWEDFSTEQQKTQRCSKCHSRGVLGKVKKLRRLPVEKRVNANANKRPGGTSGTGGLERGDEGLSTHNSTFCDMCQDIIRQRKGRSCHNLRKIAMKVTKDGTSGIVEEKIVDAE